jgi:hypothetical protein
MAAVMALALARRRYRPITVVAKSLGTSVLGHLLELAGPFGTRRLPASSAGV